MNAAYRKPVPVFSAPPIGPTPRGRGMDLYDIVAIREESRRRRAALKALRKRAAAEKLAGMVFGAPAPQPCAIAGQDQKMRSYFQLSASGVATSRL